MTKTKPMPPTAHSNSPIPSAIDTHSPLTLTAYRSIQGFEEDIETLRPLIITNNTEETTTKLFNHPVLAPELKLTLQELYADENGSPLISACIKFTPENHKALQKIIGSKITEHLKHPDTNLIWIDWSTTP